jgi:hypothetical protein
MARTIQSPGVEIREKDLSLRISTPVGTNILLPGFAPQGPTGEPIQVTTISEYEQIFGTPANPAERYLYYSMKEAVTTGANVYALRLPYGAEGASSTPYSALFYPVKKDLVNTEDWLIEKPLNVSLTEEQYNVILRGDFEWLDPDSYDSADPTTLFKLNSVNNEYEAHAGFFIVNTLQTSINEAGEGYYVGISTNDQATEDDDNHDSILQMVSLSAAYVVGQEFQNYSVIPQARLEFTLSATKVEASAGVTSISETLERVGFSAYSGSGNQRSEEFQNYLSVGVYRIRRSVANAGKLDLSSIEKYLGALDANAKKASTTGGVLENAYIEDIVNTATGASIKIFVNKNLFQYPWTAGSATPIHSVSVALDAQSLFPAGPYASNSAGANTKLIGNVANKLNRALQLATNAETYTFDVVADCGLSTIHSYVLHQDGEGAVEFNDEIDAGDVTDDTNVNDNGAGVTTLKDDWLGVVRELDIFCKEARQDCMAILDPIRSNFILGRGTKVLDIQSNFFLNHIYKPLRSCFGEIDSNYSTAYANWVSVYDTFSGKKFWLPFSGYAAAVFAKSDAAGNAWSAPAGFSRGKFSNVLDIAFNPNQKQRDRLYDVPVNPVVYFSGDGYSIFGQKTLQNRPTAFDRINVRRLFLSLKRSVAKIIRYYVFEPNTEFTRSKIVSALTPAFNYAKNTQGLYDFLIVCDSRNNTPDNIDNGELVVDIYIKPVRTAEFILVNFIATRTGQSFSEVL